jgi:uncharacterized protein involved in exopolysaccharide biosynthesis
VTGKIYEPGISSDLSLSSLTRILWARKWLIILSAALTAGAFAVIAFVMTPVYRATTIVIPAEPGGASVGGLDSVLNQFGGLAALGGFGGGGSVTGGVGVEESLAVLRSREFTEQFIREKDLMPKLYGERSLNSDDPPTFADAYKFFDREIRRVARDTRTGLITVGIEWRDPILAAEWANQLVARLNAEMRARAIEYSNASVSYLEQELTSTAIVDIRAAISRLMEAQVNLRMLANVTEEYAFRVIDRALPPDRDDVLRPQKLLMIVMGGVAGFLIGVVIVLMRRPA